MQQTRGKTYHPKAKEAMSPDRKIRETKTPMRENPSKPPASKSAKKTVEDDKKRGRKRIIDEKASTSDG